MNVKKLILGLVIGMLAGSAGTALAASGEITAVFAEFIVRINGQAQQLKTTPLVYDGKSYLPVREMANLLGYNVTYKADSRTIELNMPTPAATPAPSPSPTPTPTSTATPYTKPVVLANAKIGEIVEFMNCKIKVKALSYHEIYNGKTADGKFAVANMDIFVPSAVSDKTEWSGTDFVSAFLTGRGIDAAADKTSQSIKPGSWQNVNVSIPIEKRDTVVVVKLVDPIQPGSSAGVVIF